MYIRLEARYEDVRKLSDCLRGSACEVGQFTGQETGVEGTLIGYFGNFFTGNFPLWDGDIDTSDHMEVSLKVDNLKVDPWLCAKYEIPVSVLLPYQETPYMSSYVKGVLDYRIPKTGNKWRLKDGTEVIVDSTLSLDIDAIKDLEGVRIVNE
jgi:hypothetical protein